MKKTINTLQVQTWHPSRPSIECVRRVHFGHVLVVQREQRHKRAPADNKSFAACHDTLYSYKCPDGTVVRFACGTLGNCHLYHTEYDYQGCVDGALVLPFEDLASLRRLFWQSDMASICIWTFSDFFFYLLHCDNADKHILGDKIEVASYMLLFYNNWEQTRHHSTINVTIKVTFSSKTVLYDASKIV